jgi:hypothetical protein
MVSKAAILWIGLTIGNFLYQVVAQKNWKKAGEISFFQAVALGMFVFVS